MSREGRGRPPSRATRGRGGGGGTTGEPLAPRGPSGPELERRGRAPTPPPGGCERKEKKKSQHVVVDVVVVRPRPQRESGGWSFVRSFRSARPGPSDGSIGLEIVRLPRPPSPPDLTFRALLHAVLTSFAMLAALAFSLFFPPPRPLSRSFPAGIPRGPGARFQRTFPARMKPSPHLGRGGILLAFWCIQIGRDRAWVGVADHDYRPAESARSY